MDDEKKLLDLPSSGSAGGQEGEPVRVKSVEQKFWSACDKYKKAIVGTVIFHLIFGCLFFFLGTLVSLNYQKDAIKCIPVTCPPDWIGHQGHCYKFSREETNWKESQNFCILHNASLAKITKEEMGFTGMFTRHHVFWIGLRREPDQPWKWLDGENSTLEIMGNGGDCVFLDDGAAVGSGRCNAEHGYICKKN